MSQNTLYYSPLRYPGGKASMTNFLAYLLNINGPIETYIEPFAGGAGAALSLLFKNHVENIILNDADEFIYKFWLSVLNHTEELIEKINSTPVNIDQWNKQRELIIDEHKRKNASDIEIGFTTFYLNRCNRSGILKSGPIGGQDQSGKWKIDARFNKDDLIKRIRLISCLKDRISVYNEDAIYFIENTISNLKINLNKTLVYLDPPYYIQGKELYRVFYKKEDHLQLQQSLKKELNIKWILSYDDTSFIREIYQGAKKNGVQVNHFANQAKVGKELIIVSDNCNMPHAEEEKENKNRGPRFTKK